MIGRVRVASRICVKILVYDAILHMQRMAEEDIRTNLLQEDLQRGLRWNRRRHYNINASKQILLVRFLSSRMGVFFIDYDEAVSKLLSIKRD